MQPIVQIRQTYALIGINSNAGSFSMAQPKAEMTIDSQPGQFTINQSNPEMYIDQSRALAAYTGGSYDEMSQRIYSGVEQLWLQGIAKRMEQGERMANFHKPGNTIAEVYGEDWRPVSYPEIRGEASYDNVDIHVEPVPVKLEYQQAEVNINIEARKPEINYTPASVEIYLRQAPSVSFIPPELDIQI